MRRFLFAGVVACAGYGGVSTVLASYSDAAQAREAVFAADGALPEGDREAALRLLKAEWERSPRDVENLFALVRVCEDSNEWETGLPAARELAELGPDVAEYQYLLGNALFATIDEVSFINKGARAKAGLNAYKRAVEIEPGHMGAREGLFYFYMAAPGIAGGSETKAEEIATAMTREEANAGKGYELLVQLAAKREDWATYHSLMPRALETVASDEERANVLLTSAYTTLFRMKDYEAGLEIAAEYRRYAGEGRGGYTTNYFEGVALHGLGRFADAKEKLAAVLEVQPEAKNTRFLIAECCEKLGQKAEAAGHYDEYIKRFKDGDRVKDAKKRSKKLKK